MSLVPAWPAPFLILVPGSTDELGEETPPFLLHASTAAEAERFLVRGARLVEISEAVHAVPATPPRKRPVPRPGAGEPPPEYVWLGRQRKLPAVQADRRRRGYPPGVEDFARGYAVVNPAFIDHLERMLLEEDGCPATG